MAYYLAKHLVLLGILVLLALMVTETKLFFRAMLNIVIGVALGLGIVWLLFGR